MVFPVEYNGRIYRVGMPSLVKNRVSLLELTNDEEVDRVIRVLRSIRAYARIDGSPDDDNTIMGVFRRANERDLLPNFMKKFETIPSRSTPKIAPITQPIAQTTEAAPVAPILPDLVSKPSPRFYPRLESDNDSVFI